MLWDFFVQMVCTMPFNLINSIRCVWVLPVEIAIFWRASKTLNLSKSRILWENFWNDIAEKEKDINAQID